jgi:acyl dehydratase
MPIRYDDLISRHSEDKSFAYTDTQVMLYNLSVGMGRDPLDTKELPFVFEPPALRAVPTLASVLAGGGSNILAGADIDWSQVLHIEQRLTCHRPLPPSAELIAKTHVSNLIDKGTDKGAIVTLTMEARLASGEPLYTTDNVFLARGNGGFGAPAKAAKTPHALPDRAPDFRYVSETRSDQALLYRLNGDRNPLHASPEVARKAGFSRPILHGLCSYGVACRAVLATVCEYDVARLASFDARLTSPLFPGETLHTDIWVDGDVVSFRGRVNARNVTILNNGRCLIRPARADG